MLVSVDALVNRAENDVDEDDDDDDCPDSTSDFFETQEAHWIWCGG